MNTTQTAAPIVETQRRRRGHIFMAPKAVLRKVPALYATDGQGRDAIAHVHYFGGAFDWYLTELDPTTGRAFGMVRRYGEDGELGYFDLAELEALRVGLVIVERDKWWTPTALRDC